MSEQGPTEPQQPDALHYVHREIDAVNARVDRQDTRSENRFNLLTTLINQLRSEFNKLSARVSRVEKLLFLTIFLLLLVLAKGEIGQAIQALASALLQLLK